MKKHLLFSFFILFSNFCFAQNILEKVMNKYSDSLKFKNYGMVGFYKTKNKIQKFAVGYSAPSEKMTTDKVFNIGSLTKTFTAVLILQEVEKGNLKLNDSLKLFFPQELCQNKNVDLNITIEQLLRHRSGLGEVLVDSLANKSFGNPYFEYNYTFLFNKIPKPASKPNTEYKYCNTNYILLGYILEIINDKPYSEILKERIFEPCSMKNHYAYYSKNIKNIAHPIYNNEDLSDIGFFQFYKNFSFSAGGISSNSDDLYKFFTALYEYKLISIKTFSKMTDFGKEKYGLGLEKYTINNKTYFGHPGDNISFATRNYYNPQTKDLLILMSNNYKDTYIGKVVKDILYYNNSNLP